VFVDGVWLRFEESWLRFVFALRVRASWQRLGKHAKLSQHNTGTYHRVPNTEDSNSLLVHCIVEGTIRILIAYILHRGAHGFVLDKLLDLYKTARCGLH
jgi:hypothetical protein